jgi:hypothetical protein
LPDKAEADVASFEAHEEFIQHVEDGRGKIRLLSIGIIVVGVFLSVSYSYQILLPFLSGTKIVTVNLADPSLIIAELLILGLSVVCLYVGVANYLFSSQLGRSIQKVRTLEKSIEERILSTSP